MAPTPEPASELKCALAAEIARRFGEVRLRVVGTSMVPSVWPGDVVTVQKRELREIRIGQIALFTREGRLFAHRVVENRSSSLITRGDGLATEDPPVAQHELLGVVGGIKRGRTQVQPRASSSRWKRMAAAALRSSAILRRVVPQLVTAWNA